MKRLRNPRPVSAKITHAGRDSGKNKGGAIAAFLGDSGLCQRKVRSCDGKATKIELSRGRDSLIRLSAFRLIRPRGFRFGRLEVASLCLLRRSADRPGS